MKYIDEFDFANLFNRNNDYELNKNVSFEDFQTTIDNVDYSFDGVATFMDGNLVSVFVEFAGSLNSLGDFDELSEVDEFSDYLLENEEFYRTVVQKL